MATTAEERRLARPRLSVLASCRAARTSRILERSAGNAHPQGGFARSHLGARGRLNCAVVCAMVAPPREGSIAKEKQCESAKPTKRVISESGSVATASRTHIIRTAPEPYAYKDKCSACTRVSCTDPDDGAYVPSAVWRAPLLRDSLCIMLMTNKGGCARCQEMAGRGQARGRELL